MLTTLDENHDMTVYESGLLKKFSRNDKVLVVRLFVVFGDVIIIY